MTISRRITRKFGLHKTGSSFPYISGDTYKFSCDLIFTGNNPDFSRNFDSFGDGRDLRLFVPLPLADEFITWSESVMRQFNRVKLFFHNGDTLPPYKEIENLALRFGGIKCVNWLGQVKNIEPIPIGLENRRLHTNGVPGDFNKLIRAGIPSLGARENHILVSFSVSTNLDERVRALDCVKNLSGTDVRHFQGSVSDYQQELLRSRYVLSPPGNGYDCHRTWEAIYLGAIPVVKRAYWPFTHMDLPVIVLDDWSELKSLQTMDFRTQMSVESLRELFLQD
jgi:hypothetical protein